MRPVVVMPWWMAVVYVPAYFLTWLAIRLIMAMVWLIIMLVRMLTPIDQGDR